ncbi:Conidial development fluffy [Cordyceps militaris]|uniref:Conidial development fluffy n=1 Tax=Cordyceps militaris TaxID=73501 RepID=A0A2H4SE69_CORMI|nr:Conidial development fluffy [Cordyceps militaris]
MEKPTAPANGEERSTLRSSRYSAREGSNGNDGIGKLVGKSPSIPPGRDRPKSTNVTTAVFKAYWYWYWDCDWARRPGQAVPPGQAPGSLIGWARHVLQSTPRPVTLDRRAFLPVCRGRANKCTISWALADEAGHGRGKRKAELCSFCQLFKTKGRRHRSLHAPATWHPVHNKQMAPMKPPDSLFRISHLSLSDNKVPSEPCLAARHQIAASSADGERKSKAKIECVYAIPAPPSTDANAQSGKQKSIKPRVPKPSKSTDAPQRSDGTRNVFGGMLETTGSKESALPTKNTSSLLRQGPNVEGGSQGPEHPTQSIESTAFQRAFSTSDAEDLSDGSSSPRPRPYVSPHIDWPQARVLRVLDNILQWDCVAFCLIDRDRFKRDLQTGASAYCTPALVDALLALSVVVFRHNVIDEVANRATEKPAWDVFSATLANEAIQTLHRGKWLPEAIPDIQALGVLTLYCACNGWKDETRNFAMDFAEAMRKYRVQNAGSTGTPMSRRRVSASTYCGAISMNRPGGPIDSQETTAKHPNSIGGGTCDSQSWTDHLLRPTLANEFVAGDSELRGDDIYLVAAELYQLIEQVFKTCCVLEKDRTFAEATATYIKGLEWYQSFFKYSEAYTGREPLILFVHTYYHFCILALFTPYMMDQTVVGNGGSPPGKICEEAANIILKLMNHHDSLAGDAEPVGFMRSFKNASLEFLEVYGRLQ